MAAVDLETTGLYNSDRVVEVGVVRLDATGHTVSEFTTLVNPQRDVGPISHHGITAAMVAQAPTFTEIAGALASHLHSAVLVGRLARQFGQELRHAAWSLGLVTRSGRSFGTRPGHSVRSSGSVRRRNASRVPATAERGPLPRIASTIRGPNGEASLSSEAADSC